MTLQKNKRYNCAEAKNDKLYKATYVGFSTHIYVNRTRFR